MKLLFSMFLVPSIILTVLISLGSAWIYFDAEGLRPVANEHNFWSNIYFALIHLTLAASLAGSVVNLIYASCMTLFGFIAKTWFGAILAGGFAVLSFFLTFYLLNTTI